MPLLLIDGDVSCYQACKSRYDRVELDSDGKRKTKEFSPEEDSIYLQESWENFKKELKQLQDELFTEDYLMAVKGENNFRNLIYDEYKINRHKDPKLANLFVPILRQMAVREGYAIASEGREADDLLRIWAEQCRENNITHIICTIDKDLKCIPGKFYDMKHHKLIEISEMDAKRHYYEQLLKGDTVDHIPGLPGIGKVRAEKMLAHCQTELEMQEEVLGNYMMFYEDQWKDYLLANGKMIHLQRHPDDYFNLEDWPI